MSFLFPRTVTIRRPNHQGGGAGKKGYGGKSDAQMTDIAADVPASVQAKGTGRANPTGLPGDASPFRWVILIPDGHIAPGAIRDGDYVEDDLGRRFQVSADYAHSLGWTLNSERMEP